MKEVLPRIYQGSWKDAKDESQLRLHQITHVVNASEITIPIHETLQITSLIINVPDYEDDENPLSSHMSKVNRFIHNAWIKGGSILVHCLAGKSRSIALTLSYLGQKHHMDYLEARACLQDAGISLGDVNPSFLIDVRERIEMWQEGRKLMNESKASSVT